MRGVVGAVVAAWLVLLSAGASAQSSSLVRKHTAIGLERELGLRQQTLVEKTGDSERWLASPLTDPPSTRGLACA